MTAEDTSGGKAHRAGLVGAMTEARPVSSHMGMRRLSLGGRSFFCRDGLLEVWLAMLADAMVDDPAIAAWQRGLIEEWRSQVTVRFDGVMTSELDRHLTDAARRRGLDALCRSVRSQLVAGKAVAGPLTRRVTQRIQKRDALASVDARAGLRRVGEAMIWLLSAPDGGEAQRWL